MDLEPGLRLFLEATSPFGTIPAHQMAPADLRAAILAHHEDQPRPAGLSVSDRTIVTPAGDIAIRIYRPTSDDVLPVMLYIHGGGWVTGNLDTHDAICSGISDEVGCVVVALDYGLSPEAPYPAALDQCHAVASWIFRSAATLRVDVARSAVGGDSAGGNLSAALCLRLRDEGARNFALQVLMYPVLDDDINRPSYLANSEAPILGRDIMRYCLEHYLGGADANDAYAFPLKAAELAGVPSAYVATARHDPLLDEGAAFAQRLIAAGVACQYRSNARLVHGFLKHRAHSSEAEHEFHAMCAALKAAFAL
jgi:acetyl esterase